MCFSPAAALFLCELHYMSRIRTVHFQSKIYYSSPVRQSVVSVSQSSLVWIDADTRCKFFVANRLHVWKNHGNRGEFNVLKNSWLSRFFQLSLKFIFLFLEGKSLISLLFSLVLLNLYQNFIVNLWFFQLPLRLFLEGK